MSQGTEKRQSQSDRYSTSVFYSSNAPGKARRGYQRPQPRVATQAAPVQRPHQSQGSASADVAGLSREIRAERNGSSQAARAVVTPRATIAAVRNSGDHGEKVYPVSLMQSLDALLSV